MEKDRGSELCAHNTYDKNLSGCVYIFFLLFFSRFVEMFYFKNVQNEHIHTAFAMPRPAKSFET